MALASECVRVFSRGEGEGEGEGEGVGEVVGEVEELFGLMRYL